MGDSLNTDSGNLWVFVAAVAGGCSFEFTELRDRARQMLAARTRTAPAMPQEALF